MPFPTPISLDPPVILGFQTGRGARNDNPRTGGDKKNAPWVKTLWAWY